MKFGRQEKTECFTMAEPIPQNFVMSEPQSPTSASPEKPLVDPGTIPSAEMLANAPRKRFAGEVLFFAGEDLRPEWRALGYFIAVALTTYWVMWLGVSLFAEPCSRSRRIVARDVSGVRNARRGDVARDRARQF